MTNSSESVDASPKRSIYETGRFVGGAGSLESEGDPDAGLGGSTMIFALVDPEEGGTLLDGPRPHNEECNPEKAAIVSFLKYQMDSRPTKTSCL